MAAIQPARPTSGMWFAPPAPPPPTKEEIAAAKEAEKASKPKRERFKNDPKHVAAARELRDRYLEQVNADRMLPSACGKYDVSRQLAAPAAPSELKHPPVTHLLNAA